MSVAERPDKTAPAQSKPGLLVFYAPTVGNCRRVEGFVSQVLQRRRNHDTFQVTWIDVTARPDLAARFRINSVPTLVVIDDKRVQARLEEPRGCAAIADLLTPWLR